MFTAGRLPRSRGIQHRNEIIPGLWLGDFYGALQYEELRKDNIFYILSVLGAGLPIDPRLTRFEIDIEDSESSDLLIHFPPAITFLQKAMESGRGVLVHCQAGISRGPSVVAAYLIFTRNMTVSHALNTIKEKRSFISPNDSFMRQLGLFQTASCSITNGDKAARAYYLERAVQDVRAGKRPSLTMLAEHDSMATNLPTGKARRIRCKICRTELASQGHAVDHGQLDGSIPAGAPEAKQAGPLHFYALKSTQGDELPSEPDSDAVAVQATATSKRIMRSYTAAEGSSSQSSLSDVSKVSGALGAQIMLGAVEAKLVSPPSSRATARQHRPTFPPPSRPPVARPRPTDDAQSASASTSLPVTGAILQELRINPTSGGPAPPIMIGPKCSGYFLEPMKWMDPFLEAGLLEGKIICPNAKCGVKLGNYAWAGMCCSCQNWVTPGFCIHKSKVDEIW